MFDPIVLQSIASPNKYEHWLQCSALYFKLLLYISERESYRNQLLHKKPLYSVPNRRQESPENSSSPALIKPIIYHFNPQRFRQKLCKLLFIHLPSVASRFKLVVR